MRLRSGCGILFSLALAAAGAPSAAADSCWTEFEFQSKPSSKFVAVNWVTVTGWLKLAANGEELSGNSEVLSGLAHFSQGLGASGMRWKSWTKNPNPTCREAAGEVEFTIQGEVWCKASALTGLSAAQARGEVLAEVWIDGVPVADVAIEVNVAQQSEDGLMVSAGPMIGLIGTGLGAAALGGIQTGHGVNEDEATDGVPFQAICGQTIGRLQTSRVHHKLTAEAVVLSWPVLEAADARADSTGRTSYPVWSLIPDCPQ